MTGPSYANNENICSRNWRVKVMSNEDKRWSTKMLTPEFMEHYNRRNDPKDSPAEPDLAAVRDYVVLPLLLDMVQKALRQLDTERDLLKPVFTACGQIIAKQISSDIYAHKRELRRRNIRITGDEQVDNAKYYIFTCRGAECRVGITREWLRSELSVRMGYYVSMVADRMKDDNPATP